MSLTNAALPRRYDMAQVIARDGAFIVQLDDKDLLTPARAALRLPTLALATAIAAEWNRQGKAIDPASMPLSQLSMTGVDRVAPQRAAIETSLLAFLDTELICHEGEDEGLRALQQERWQTARDWLRATHGVTLPVTTGLSPVTFDKGWAQVALTACDIWQLTALQQAAAALSSLMLAMALLDGALTAESALDAAEVEADFQARRWGVDEATATRRAALLQEVQDIARFTQLLKEA